jgi:hypothetical protein
MIVSVSEVIYSAHLFYVLSPPDQVYQQENGGPILLKLSKADADRANSSVRRGRWSTALLRQTSQA